MKIFADRVQAGQLLAEKLKKYQNHPAAIVLALPRGGVPVAYEISKALQLPLDLMLVRKLGSPGNEELAMGAIAMGDVVVFNEEIVHSFYITEKYIQKKIVEQKIELQRRNELYREGRPFPDLKDMVVILVDDGLATGATMRSAVQAVKKMQPAKVVVAIPVSAHDTFLKFQHEVDEIICLEAPQLLYSIGQWYHNFSQTTDEEVCDLLKLAKNVK